MFGENLNTITLIIIKEMRGRFEHTNTEERHKKRNHVKEEADIAVMQLQAKEH